MNCRVRKIIRCTLNPVRGMIVYQLNTDEIRRASVAALQVTKQRRRFSKNVGSAWHKGAFRSPEISTRIGFFGEIAFWQIMSVYFKDLPMPAIDVDRRVRRFDFDWNTPFGSRHEVKTTIGSADGERNYVREDAAELADVFWFIATHSDGSGRMVLRGWISAEDLSHKAQKLTGRGGWKNLVIATEDLNPVSRFIREMKGA